MRRTSIDRIELHTWWCDTRSSTKCSVPKAGRCGSGRVQGSASTPSFTTPLQTICCTNKPFAPTRRPLIFLLYTHTLPPNMASTTAQRRLLQEYRALTNNPPEGITAGPVSEDDLLYWEALIQGPEGTPFEGGVFPAELKFPKDYPLAPPSMRFLGEVWHPNSEWSRAPPFSLCDLQTQTLGYRWSDTDASQQSIPAASSASASFTHRETTQTTTNTPPSAGRPSKASRKS